MHPVMRGARLMLTLALTVLTFLMIQRADIQVRDGVMVFFHFQLAACILNLLYTYCTPALTSADWGHSRKVAIPLHETLRAFLSLSMLTVLGPQNDPTSVVYTWALIALMCVNITAQKHSIDPEDACEYALQGVVYLCSGLLMLSLINNGMYVTGHWALFSGSMDDSKISAGTLGFIHSFYLLLLVALYACMSFFFPQLPWITFQKLAAQCTDGEPPSEAIMELTGSEV